MTSSNLIQVLLVDDHEVVREGCRRSLMVDSDIEVVAEANSGELAYRIYDSYMPDVVIMDLSLPGIGGIETIKRILNRHPLAKIIIFTMHGNPVLVRKALQIGAKGFLNKATTPIKLADAVRVVMAGKIYIDPGIAEAIAIEELSEISNPLASLSVRELEIFRHITNGKSTTEVAEILHLSPKTVSNNSCQIKKKLGASTIAELIRIGTDAGIVTQI